MSIGAIEGSTSYASPQAAGKPQGTEEATVSTKPAPKAGENGYWFDKTV